jgi:hypothetical protein
MTYHYYAATGAVLAMLGAATTFITVRLADGVNISDTLKGR